MENKRVNEKRRIKKGRSFWRIRESKKRKRRQMRQKGKYYVPFVPFKKGWYSVIYMNTWVIFHVFMVRDGGKKGALLVLKIELEHLFFFFLYNFQGWIGIAPLSLKKFFLVLFFWSFLGLFSIMVTKYIYKRRTYTSYIILFISLKKQENKKGPKKDQKGPKRTKKGPKKDQN